MWTTAIVLLLPALALIAALLGLNRPLWQPRRIVKTDHLTSSLTRDEFQQHLTGMLQSRRASELKQAVVVVCLDLDRFRQLNNTHGRDSGDQVLCEFANRLRLRLRPTDLIARICADKFLLAVRLPNDTDPLLMINRLRTRAIVDGFETDAGPVHIGTTAGLACHQPNETTDSLLARAEQALLTGKVRMRNRCYLAPTASQQETDWRAKTRQTRAGKLNRLQRGIGQPTLIGARVPA